MHETSASALFWLVSCFVPSNLCHSMKFHISQIFIKNSGSLLIEGPRRLDGVSLPVLLDMGATVSLLNLAKWKHFFSQKPLGTSPTTLRSYGNSEFDIVGPLQLPVRLHLPCVMPWSQPTFQQPRFFSTWHHGIHTVASPWQQYCSMDCLMAFTHQPLSDNRNTSRGICILKAAT